MCVSTVLHDLSIVSGDLSLSFQETDGGIHENIPLQDCDELTRNAQTILMRLSFGAYREILTMVRTT